MDQKQEIAAESIQTAEPKKAAAEVNPSDGEEAIHVSD